MSARDLAVKMCARDLAVKMSARDRAVKMFARDLAVKISISTAEGQGFAPRPSGYQTDDVNGCCVTGYPVRHFASRGQR